MHETRDFYNDGSKSWLEDNYPHQTSYSAKAWINSLRLNGDKNEVSLGKHEDLENKCLVGIGTALTPFKSNLLVIVFRWKSFQAFELQYESNFGQIAQYLQEVNFKCLKLLKTFDYSFKQIYRVRILINKIKSFKKKIQTTRHII